ncbi:MAG: ion transporter [Pseudomonadota bacterium]|nr:ion transporter [Pseudomonadota bacterium]
MVRTKLVNAFLKIRNSKVFNILVISVIIASALYAGVSSYNEIIPSDYLFLLQVFDYSITIFFTIEILIRIFAERSLVNFFKDGWNIFDFLIVSISLIPIGGAESIFVARLLRIVRILRIITVVPAFRHIIDSLIKTIPRVGFIALLMFIFIYIWGAIGTLFFDEINPERWGNIGVAMLTLVQVATYDDWAAVMRELIVVYPVAWIYFVSFIIINAVVLLNMVIGVIVDVMTKESREAFVPDDEKTVK